MSVPDFKDLLNPNQYAATTHEGGPILIVAGAGSGKTRTLVHRVAYLVGKGVAPENILLLTFTRKAAQEMLTRSELLVGSRAGRVAGGTFHSLANLILRKEAKHLGFSSDFGILDQDDAESLINRIRDEIPYIKNDRSFPKKGAILGLISQSRNKEIPIGAVLNKKNPWLSHYTPNLEAIAGKYETLKYNNGVMDFDDLLIFLAKVMIENESVRQRIASNFEYILVDEYQDTNPVQARITYLLGKDHGNVTAVGDEAQSIYGFRGADFRNIMDFKKIFPNARILKLEENYRSVSPILEIANGVLFYALETYKKNLRAIRQGGAKPLMVVVEDLRDEAVWVGNRIEELIGIGTPPGQIAVLFRAAAHSFELELELNRRDIPFIKYGGRKFLESSHIKDFLSFLRVAQNPSDTTSMIRVLKLHEGVGVKGASDIAEWVNGDRGRLLSLDEAPLRGKSQETLKPLIELYSKIGGEGDDLEERLNLVYKYYKPLIPMLYTADSKDRAEDIDELYAIGSLSGSLSSFLADVTLDPPNAKISMQSSRENPQDVTLSTIHSAKGLEWKYVFILSMVEGRFPVEYFVKTPEDLEEERRLLYVAVTRAKDELYLMCPEYVDAYNSPGDTCPSRFLDGLHEDTLDIIKEGKNVPYRKLFNNCRNNTDKERSGPREQDLQMSIEPIVEGFDKKENSSTKERNVLVKKTPIRRKKAAKRAEQGTEVAILAPTPGQSVNHATFGVGRVLSVKGNNAIIDFDSYGRKNINFIYGKLYETKESGAN
jgi:DNA helicase-2/ATP-dependent DNA helicase PcrA